MAHTQISTATEQERVEAFTTLGFGHPQAVVLATTQEAGEQVDLDLVRRLLDAGCDHDLALRIVI
jgi:hypothetical protein